MFRPRRSLTTAAALVVLAAPQACSENTSTNSTPHPASDAAFDVTTTDVTDGTTTDVMNDSDDAAIDTRPDVPETALDSADSAPIDPACATIAKDATQTVHLRITADNECVVFVNGTNAGKTTSWPSPVTLDVSLFIYPGRFNVIAVQGTNTSSQDGNDRGIIGELDTVADGGSTPVIVTDKAWRSAKGPNDKGTGTPEEPGWEGLAFDDEAWIAATEIASHGDGPWGPLFGTSSAKWLWSAAVPVGTADKPNFEVAYFRRKFYFATDGTTISSTPACP